jgi:hypothetical protein
MIHNLVAAALAITALGYTSPTKFSPPASGPRCDIANITQASDLHKLLSRSAVAAARLAAMPRLPADGRLNYYVAPTATFNLGAGDAGRPMGQGVAGLRAMMAAIGADHYRFDGWDYVDVATKPCEAQMVTVEFSNLKRGGRAEVKFKFLAGQIVEGSGGWRSMTTGSFP